MFDDAIDPYDTGLRELTRRLEAFADTRLSPSLSATSRMRINVMNAAHRRAAMLAADPGFETAAAPVHVARSRFALHAWRRPAAALMAACLTLAIVGSATSAASAGGPLYATRIWVEMANLPTGALARADAEVARLESRLREAQEAYAHGDGPAAEAALAAYSAILTEAVQGSAADADASAEIEANLARHVAVLTALIDSVSAAAQEAIRHALASSSTVLEKLDDSIVGRPPDGGLPAMGPTGPTTPDGGKPPGTKTDSATPKPSPKSEQTPAPDRTGHSNGNGGTPPGQPDPAGTSRPDPTPRASDRPTSPKSGGT
jgi:hypothetical protein